MHRLRAPNHPRLLFSSKSHIRYEKDLLHMQFVLPNVEDIKRVKKRQTHFVLFYSLIEIVLIRKLLRNGIVKWYR